MKDRDRFFQMLMDANKYSNVTFAGTWSKGAGSVIVENRRVGMWLMNDTIHIRTVYAGLLKAAHEHGFDVKHESDLAKQRVFK